MSLDPESLIGLCKRRGIWLAVRDGELLAGPPDRLDGTLRAALIRRRDRLVAFLLRPLRTKVAHNAK